jgi:hypothetical protein
LRGLGGVLHDWRDVREALLPHNVDEVELTGGLTEKGEEVVEVQHGMVVLRSLARGAAGLVSYSEGGRCS